MTRVQCIGTKSSAEEWRLSQLRALCLLDTPRETAFERVVDLLQRGLNVPVSAVSLVDRDRLWLKASRGVRITEAPRDLTFCTYTIMGETPLVVQDASCDARFAECPFVTDGARVRSYAGMPLILSAGEAVGALCVLDKRPRVFSDGELELLRSFAEVVVEELELRRMILSHTRERRCA